MVCSCALIVRLDGDEARTYAAEHLQLIERGRDRSGAEDYACAESRTAWVMDFPFRHWAADHRGAPRLRRMPLPQGDPPVGAPD